MLALLQVGEAGMAEDEMQALLPRAGPDLAAGIQAVAQIYELPSVALGLGVMGESQPGLRADADLYPVPRWTPPWRLHRRPGASLRACAPGIGLQSAGPKPGRRHRAAADHAGHGEGARLPVDRAPRSRGQSRHGRRPTLKRLLADPMVEGDLFMMAIAYNAGPGTLAKWRAADTTDDALLFIESLPNQETRSFVERVMANIWIYQQRLGQSTPTLDMVASGVWPRYQGQDGLSIASSKAGRQWGELTRRWRSSRSISPS